MFLRPFIMQKRINTTQRGEQSMAKYAVGVDFGTLSARAVVVEIGTGRELGGAAQDYPHGVLDFQLPDGTPIKPSWALQVPGDYVECLYATVASAVREAGVNPADIVGLGIDVTSNTMLPVDASDGPLCEQEHFSSNPYAYIMLWKHHGAQEYAERIERIAKERHERFLHRYGHGVSAEWMLPKLWQIAQEAPEVYDAADRFLEVGDWLVLKMTGHLARSESMAGYKAFWSREDGYPSEEFLALLHPSLRTLASDKLRGDVVPLGTCVGTLLPEAAARMGLQPGIAIATANIDAHVSLPGIGLTDPGILLMIMGTSTCHIMLGEKEMPISGICGVVRDGVVPGTYGYEAGQSCCGDHFRWLLENALPSSVEREAQEKGMDVHALLSMKAARLRPGESGLLALDWWNGNRSVLMDMDLSGLMLGMTLQTKPEEIYRALIEATAFGMRRILEGFEENGLPVHQLLACGGIARKNPLFMQIYADVSGREIRIGRSSQTPALGSAMFGAVAAGKAGGGYDSIREAAAEMGAVDPKPVIPDPQAHAVYNELYEEYKTLHDWFGRGGNPVMKHLRGLRNQMIEERMQEEIRGEQDRK